MKKIGIAVDGVVRDFLTQFDKQYRKSFIHNYSIVGMDENFTLKENTFEEEEKIAEKIQEDTNKRICLPVDTNDLLNHYVFEPGKGIRGEQLTSKEKLEEFIYDLYPFQIFGQADQYNDAMNDVNFIQRFGIDNNLYEVTLFSKLQRQSITATYFFLSKTACRVKNMLFLERDENPWDYFDIIIDAESETFENKTKKENISIKINRLYNQWNEADYSFNDIKEVAKTDFLNKISLL